MNSIAIDSTVPVITVMVQGLLSFFSPCVLPLVPLYVGYLAGGTGEVDAQGQIHYPRRRVMGNTVFFVVGVSFAFFLLGFGFTAIGRFFSARQQTFVTISGLIMIFFGLYQMGFLGRFGAMEQERRLPFRLDRWAMNPMVALILGFTFSFAWTPCVGPTLGSVLLMASSAGSAAKGFLLIGVYTAGFVLPFLAVGLFASGALSFFKRHQRIVRYTVKIGALLLIFMGVMTIGGFTSGISGSLASAGSTEQQTGAASSSSASQSSTEGEEAVAAPDFTLMDQDGNTHTLSDYQGKVVFLNFWATWCGPCQEEMPEIQALYEEYGYNEEDVVVIGVANPRTEDQPYNQDVTQAEVEQFLTDRGYSFPVVMDTTGEVFAQYGIQAFPTTFLIDAQGNVFGYLAGQMTREMMDSAIEQTLAA